MNLMQLMIIQILFLEGKITYFLKVLNQKQNLYQNHFHSLFDLISTLNVFADDKTMKKEPLAKAVCSPHINLPEVSMPLEG